MKLPRKWINKFLTKEYVNVSGARRSKPESVEPRLYSSRKSSSRRSRSEWNVKAFPASLIIVDLFLGASEARNQLVREHTPAHLDTCLIKGRQFKSKKEKKGKKKTLH